jgi:hypothetical protein
VNPKINAFFALLPEAYTPFDPLIDDASIDKSYNITDPKQKLKYEKTIRIKIKFNNNSL